MARVATARLFHLSEPPSALANISSNTLDLLRARPEFSGVFRGREITRKTRRLAAQIHAIDQLTGGGIARGRISELTGSAGKTSLAAVFAASAINRGEAAAWLDLEGRCDPASMIAAGVDPTRLLWASPAPVIEADAERCSVKLEETGDDAANEMARYQYRNRRGTRARPERALLKAAEWLMAAGGFGLVVIDFGGFRWPLPPSVALRVARSAEQSGTAVIVIGARRMCGTFAALSIAFDRSRPCFSRACPGAPLLFEGFMADLRVVRNKLGGSHDVITWKLSTDPYPPEALAKAAVPAAIPPAWPPYRAAGGDVARA